MSSVGVVTLSTLNQGDIFTQRSTLRQGRPSSVSHSYW